MTTARISILMVCQKLGGQKNCPPTSYAPASWQRWGFWYSTQKHTWNIPRISPRFNYGYTTTLFNKKHVPYERHHNPLLIINRSWILTVHKVRILWKKLLKKTFLAFQNGVKNIQTAGYNGARTVYVFEILGEKVWSYHSATELSSR